MVIKNVAFRSVLITSLALLATLAIISVTAINQTRDVLMQQLAEKAQIETEQTARRIARALGLGIPLTQLVGVDQLYNGMHAADANIAFLAVIDADREVVHAAGLGAAEAAEVVSFRGDATANQRQFLSNTYLVTLSPLTIPGAGIGEIALGYNESVITEPLRSNLLDVIIILIVVLLLSFEVLLLLFTVNAVLPGRTAITVLESASRGAFAFLHGQVMRDEMGRVMARLNQAVRRAAPRNTEPGRIAEPRVIGVRMLAFLFVFAEELARPIMAPFFQAVTSVGGHLGDDSTVGWVIGSHMIMVAIVMPLASLYYQRIGRRRMYVLGAIIATCGLVGTGLAQGFWDLLAWRAISGCGYAITFTACQAFVLESTDRTRRSQAIAMMVSGIMLADICGPAIGGVVAGQIGPRGTFLVGAGLAILAAALVPMLMGRNDTRPSDETLPQISWATVLDTVHNPRLLVLLFMVAAPAKFLLAGYLYYLVPMHLIAGGSDIAEIGRVLMIYGLTALLLGPAFARLADRMGNHAVLAGMGGIVSGLGLMLTLAGADLPFVICGVAALGVGQALSIPAQVAVAIEVSDTAIARHGQGAVMAVMRLVERLFGGLGPVAAATTAHVVGLDRAMGLLGIGALGLGILFLISFTVLSRRTAARAPS